MSLLLRAAFQSIEDEKVIISVIYLKEFMKNNIMQIWQNCTIVKS